MFLNFVNNSVDNRHTVIILFVKFWQMSLRTLNNFWQGSPFPVFPLLKENENLDKNCFPLISNFLK